MKKFTDKEIKNLKAADKKYYQREAHGFTIRVMPSGVKTWLFIYSFDGKRKEMNLGMYPDVSLATARDKFDAARKMIANGLDPADADRAAKEERRKAPTVAELVHEYLTKHAMLHKRSWKEDERAMNRDVIPAWGKRKAADIRKRDVVDLLQGVVDRGSPIMGNNLFEKIRKMFNFAVEKDILEFSPCFGVKAPSAKVSVDRVLADDEIRLFWNGIDKVGMTDEMRRCLKLILTTGQRPGECVGLHSNEIDGSWWTVPAARAKNGKEHRVFLTGTALELIGNKTGFVFESPVSGKKLKEDGTPKDPQHMDINAVSRAIRRVLQDPGEVAAKDERQEDQQPEATPYRLIMESWTPHDLRRTGATRLSELGYSDEIIDAILNHVKKGVIATYNRNCYDKEKQAALEAWSRKLNQIVTGEGKSNVIPMRRAA